VKPIRIHHAEHCAMIKLLFAVFLEWKYLELPSLIWPIYSLISVLVGII